MSYHLLFTDQANDDLNALEKTTNFKKKRLKAVRNEDIFEAYAENNTPAAYRIFWHYGPEKKDITIIAITSHP
ncbi:MAG: hypothetical protein K0R24_1679 [Gammaproteobacteria bacterium]|jgi:hypothetical protein|nr:hypothetical protein [Gammaproteobacteria bacterium]MCE3238698.1 hypothetical protein [Gammaproteobacteria bacterium]